MPRVSEFYGIVINMYYDERESPHFHAFYGGYRAQVGIDPVRVMGGRLPRRAQSMVIEWAAQHQDELKENSRLAQAHEALTPVAPLD